MPGDVLRSRDRMSSVSTAPVRTRAAATGSFDVLWNDVVIATVSATGTEMRSYSYMVTPINGDNVLRFRGTGTADATGASLDNVRLHATVAAVGNDTLNGGAGSDTFAFNGVLGVGNVDTIDDFAVGQDQIALASAVFPGLTAGALATDAFVIGTAAADADDRVVYDDITGSLYFDADGNASGAAVEFAVLASGLGLASTSFVVI